MRIKQTNVILYYFAVRFIIYGLTIAARMLVRMRLQIIMAIRFNFSIIRGNSLCAFELFRGIQSLITFILLSFT